MAIVHAHSPMVITVSIAGIKLKAVKMAAIIFPSEVPMFEKYGLVVDMDQGER